MEKIWKINIEQTNLCLNEPAFSKEQNEGSFLDIEYKIIALEVAKIDAEMKISNCKFGGDLSVTGVMLKVNMIFQKQ